MFIGSEAAKYKGKLATPGMVLRLSSDPSISKSGGTCRMTFDAYANVDDFEEKSALKKRYMEVTLCSSKEKATQLSSRGTGPDEIITIAYHCPDVVRCWGKTPKNSEIADADWPSNLWAQAQLLAGLLPEFKEFSSDEPDLASRIAKSAEAKNS